ncbi:hypothetical protein D3C86_1861690 [compost metagenome]
MTMILWFSVFFLVGLIIYFQLDLIVIIYVIVISILSICTIVHVENYYWLNFRSDG